MKITQLNQPNKKYDHVYVLLRYDTYISDPRQAINVLKIFSNESDAIVEAERLNVLEQKRNDARVSVYYVLQSRIAKGLLNKGPRSEL